MPRTEAPRRRLFSLLSRESSRLFFGLSRRASARVPTRHARVRAPRQVILALVLLASLLPAQTLPQAEALWKTRRYQDANAVFRDLAAREPRNPEIRVRWGRMFLEHWQADEADRLFNEALELRSEEATSELQSLKP